MALNLAQTKYAMTAFHSKWKYEKLAVRLIVRVRGNCALLICRERL